MEKEERQQVDLFHDEMNRWEVDNGVHVLEQEMGELEMFGAETKRSIQSVFDEVRQALREKEEALVKEVDRRLAERNQMIMQVMNWRLRSNETFSGFAAATNTYQFMEMKMGQFVPLVKSFGEMKGTYVNKSVFFNGINQLNVKLANVAKTTKVRYFADFDSVSK